MQCIKQIQRAQGKEKYQMHEKVMGWEELQSTSKPETPQEIPQSVLACARCTHLVINMDSFHSISDTDVRT